MAFTGHASASAEFAADSHGFVGLITKPFDADEFVAGLIPIVQAIRKLELPKRNNNFGTRPYETNQMFMLTVSNLFGSQ